MRIEFEPWCEQKRREADDAFEVEALARVLAAHPGCTAATCVTIAAIERPGQ